MLCGWSTEGPTSGEVVVACARPWQGNCPVITLYNVIITLLITLTPAAIQCNLFQDTLRTRPVLCASPCQAGVDAWPSRNTGSNFVVKCHNYNFRSLYLCNFEFLSWSMKLLITDFLWFGYLCNYIMWASLGTGCVIIDVLQELRVNLLQLLGSWCWDDLT